MKMIKLKRHRQKYNKPFIKYLTFYKKVLT